jgi:hypothetical protein
MDYFAGLDVSVRCQPDEETLNKLFGVLDDYRLVEAT